MSLTPEFVIPFILFSGAMLLSLFSIIYILGTTNNISKWILVIFIGILLYAAGVIGYTSKCISTKVLLLLNASPNAFLLIPVGFYFFVRHTLGLKHFKLNYILHFIPVVAFYFIFLLYREPLPPNIASQQKDPLMFVFGISIILSILVYFFAILITLKRHKERYKNFFASDSTFITLNWARKIIISVLAFGLIYALSTFLPFDGHYTILQYAVRAIAFTGLLFVFAFYGMQQPLLYVNTEITNERIPVENQTIKKETQNSLRLEVDLNQVKLLEREMKTTKMFLKKQVRISQLSSHLKIPAHKLSYMINTHYEMNFFQFINSYRIKYACDLLQNSNYSKYTLEAIAKESGFNSKSTFNNRFREVIGMTPNEFKKKAQEKPQVI